MSCSRARRELLEHFALGEEFGPRSGPHLAHLQSCAECRREVGIDRALVASLRRALKERVEGRSPSASSWELVRRRTIDQPARPWTAVVLQWGGMVSAAAVAGIMMFAVVTAPESTSFPGSQSLFVANAARRAVPPVDEARGLPAEDSSTYSAPQSYHPPLGWPKNTQLTSPAASRDADPPITGHMR